jgi:flagellar biosynthetic protein FliR
MNDPIAMVALGILLVRPGVLVVATPIFGGTFVPPHVRVALTVILAVLLMPAVRVPQTIAAANVAWIVAGEVVVGVALSMGIRVLIAGAELAGHVAGFQIGLSYAALVDPMSGARNNLLSVLYASLAILTFLGVNGHHAMLRALARSYEMLPPGTWHMDPGMAGTVARLLGIVFLLGTQLALPIVIVLLLVEVVLGLVSRAAPALNLMVIGFPLRVGIGLLALGVGIQVVPGVIARYAPAALETASRLAWGHR